MGPDLQLPRPDGRRASSTTWTTPSAQAGLPLRHHLRHQQRVRLRLPARQHEVRRSTTTCSASSTTPSSTRSTRSSSTRRARRSSSPARPRSTDSTTVDRIIPKLITGEEITAKYDSKDRPATIIVDEKAHTVVADRGGRRSRRRSCSACRNLYDPANIETLHHVNQALARPHPLQARRRLHRRRTARSSSSTSSPGRLMPGRRWSDGLHQAVEAKERRDDRGGEPDPGHDHLPELLPHVREARRHDRHRRDRGRGVRARSTSSTWSSSRPTSR